MTARGLEVLELGNEDLRNSCQYDPSNVRLGAAPLPEYPQRADLPEYELADAEFVDKLDLPSFAPPLPPRRFR